MSISPLDEVHTLPLIERISRKDPDEAWGPHDHDEPHEGHDPDDD